MSEPIKILFLAAEAEPFIKIGGLADVAGSLPLALRALPVQDTNGITLDVRLVLPHHRIMRINSTILHPITEFSIPRHDEDIPVKVYEISSGGMPVYFINGAPLSSTPSVYSKDPASDREKYAFFSLAAIELTRHLNWQPDIVHANDWHTALALYALRSRNSNSAKERIHTVFTVHNLPYMGGDAADVMSAYGLEPLEENSLPTWARSQPLPLGLWAADAIIPVSPTYAEEIQTPEFGCDLYPYLQTRRDKITGILNGLDYICWNPETDKTLAARFTAAELPTRAINRAAIQKALNLKEDSSLPLLVMIGRIDQQKGLDITFEALRHLAGRDWQFVLLGSGDPELESIAHNLQEEFPERIRVVIRYDEALGRLLYGGADMLLMPSRYEPCGLAQMIAMRYGCVPVVHATGGLKDTVKEGKTGFLFDEAKAGSMVEGVVRALTVYTRQEEWQQIQRNGMKEDFSWPHSARQYATIYRLLMSNISDSTTF